MLIKLEFVDKIVQHQIDFHSKTGNNLMLQIHKKWIMGDIAY